MLIWFRVACGMWTGFVELGCLLISRGGSGFIRRITSDISRLIDMECFGVDAHATTTITTTANVVSKQVVSLEISLIEVDAEYVEMYG